MLELRGLAIALAFVGALAVASPAKAETAATTELLSIPDVPRDGSRFGVLIAGEPDGTAIAARKVVSRALESEGHPTEIIPSLEAVPRREDVLRICAQHELDGIAVVSLRRGESPAQADVVVRDANGDPFRGQVVPDPDGWALRTPLLTESKATFVVPAPESPSAAEPRPAPLGRLPPLLWFDERDGTALIGERMLPDGKVYRLLGRPDLELSFERRTNAKDTLLATGIAASAVGLLLGPALIASGHGPSIGWSSDQRANFFFVDGAILAVGVGAFAAWLSIDPHPIALRERLARARAFNAAQLR